MTHEDALSFGPFSLFRSQRLLVEDQRPVRIGGRALDILIALVQRPGEVIGKEELSSIVWPEVRVEDANLRVQIGALRKLLGDCGVHSRYIATVPGRGYSFVAPVWRRAPS